MGLGQVTTNVNCVRMLAMEQPEEQPLHLDGPKSKYNLTLIFSLVVAVIGLATGATFLLILGLLGAGMNYFTTAKRYLIYKKALVVVYGRPRVKEIPFSEISHLEMLVMPGGNRLRVRMVSGKRLVVSVSDIDQFRTRLDDALEKFNGTYGEPNIIDQEPHNRTPY